MLQVHIRFLILMSEKKKKKYKIKIRGIIYCKVHSVHFLLCNNERVVYFI